MWNVIARDLARGETVVAGVLSGTSADGIDVGLVRVHIDGLAAGPLEGAVSAPPRVVGLECVAFATEPFDVAAGGPVPGLTAAGRQPAAVDLAERVRAVLERRAVPGPRELALLDRDLGRAFGRAARAVADRHGYRLGLVASHGQTIWHHDGLEASGPATLQLGDGDEVAEAAGAAVACDFRRRDIAAGGEGAPLSALADPLVFARAPQPLCLLNLGGIANLTLVRQCASLETVAFDVGPANALLDGLARALLGRPYDADGAVAAGGVPCAAWVDELLGHPFFAVAPPKSTGRDMFGGEWLRGVLAGAAARGLSTPDTLASAALVVARSVARDVGSWGAWLAAHGAEGAPPAPLIVAGGGVHHAPLMACLASELGLATDGAAHGGAHGSAPGGPVGGARGPSAASRGDQGLTPGHASTRAAQGRAVVTSAAVGVPPDAREALVFAALGARCLIGEPSTLPGATGARPGRVLGKLVTPPPTDAARLPR
ncbi:MAG: anhydro-N-acetylmuramic acid kinase [Planctomycetota bacterium]